METERKCGAGSEIALLHNKLCESIMIHFTLGIDCSQYTALGACVSTQDESIGPWGTNGCDWSSGQCYGK